MSILVIRSTARKGYRSAAQRRRVPLSAWTAKMLPNPLVFERDQSDCRHISAPGSVTFPVVGTNLGKGAPNRPPDSDRACRKVNPNRRNRNVQSHANRTRRRRLCSSRGIARPHTGHGAEQGRDGKNDEGKSSQDHEGAGRWQDGEVFRRGTEGQERLLCWGRQQLRRDKHGRLSGQCIQARSQRHLHDDADAKGTGKPHAEGLIVGCRAGSAVPAHLHSDWRLPCRFRHLARETAFRHVGGSVLRPSTTARSSKRCLLSASSQSTRQTIWARAARRTATCRPFESDTSCRSTASDSPSVPIGRSMRIIFTASSSSSNDPNPVCARS